jgi:hypothetical protein
VGCLETWRSLPENRNQRFEILTNLGMLKRLIDSALVLPMGGVEVVLDAVVTAAGQLFGYVGPLVAQLLVEVENLLFFVLIDGILFYVRIQVVMPSKS